MRFSYLFFLLLLSPLSAEPWGKDAELVCRKPYQRTAPQSPLQKVATALIRFHQTTIAEADGPRSHFYPSSSRYTLQAIQKYGFLHGYLMGCDRLMRENNDPWVYSTLPGKYNLLKYDPVP